MSFWSTLAGLAGPIVGAVVGGPIGAAIGTGVSALGSGLAQDESNKNYLQGVNDTNASNYAIAQQNNQEAWRRLLQQNQFNVDMWNKQNAYNSPSAMMARLRQAGLNPAAFTGESPAAQVTSAQAPGMSTPTMQAPGQTPVADYGRLYYERLAANEMVKKAQIDNADSSLRLSFLAQEKKQDLLEQAARISNMKADTTEKNWAVRKAAQEYEHFASIAKDLERGTALQVDSLEQNMKVQNEDLKLRKREADRQDLMYKLAVDANDRDWKRLSNELSATNLGYKQFAFEQEKWNDPVSRATRKSVAREAYRNSELLKQKFNHNEKEFEKALESLEIQVKQQHQDLGNPFHYVGALLGGTPGAVVKLVK